MVTRFRIVGMIVLVLGCSKLAPDDTPLPPLAQLQGTVEDVESVEDKVSLLRVALSWHVMHPEGLNDRYVAQDETGVELDGEGQYELTIRSPPPDRARITADELGIDAPEGSWLALGFLTVFDPVDEGDSLEWSDIFDYGFAVTWGGNDAYLVLYWSSSEPLNGEALDLDWDTIDPGIHLLRDGEDGAFEELVSMDESISLLPEGNYTPAYEICRWREEGEIVDIWSDAPEFPTSFPEYESVSCQECGANYMHENCTVYMNVLCSDCTLDKVWVDETNVPDGWPCFPDGTYCNGQVDVTTCVLGTKYACQDEEWVPTEVCDDSCCGEDATCTAIASDPADPDDE